MVLDCPCLALEAQLIQNLLNKPLTKFGKGNHFCELDLASLCFFVCTLAANIKLDLALQAVLPFPQKIENELKQSLNPKPYLFKKNGFQTKWALIPILIKPH